MHQSHVPSVGSATLSVNRTFDAYQAFQEACPEYGDIVTFSRSTTRNSEIRPQHLVHGHVAPSDISRVSPGFLPLAGHSVLGVRRRSEQNCARRGKSGVVRRSTWSER